jgi:hypothetical protein
MAESFQWTENCDGNIVAAEAAAMGIFPAALLAGRYQVSPGLHKRTKLASASMSDSSNPPGSVG